MLQAMTNRNLISFQHGANLISKHHSHIINQRHDVYYLVAN